MDFAIGDFGSGPNFDIPRLLLDHRHRMQNASKFFGRIRITCFDAISPLDVTLAAALQARKIECWKQPIFSVHYAQENIAALPDEFNQHFDVIIFSLSLYHKSMLTQAHKSLKSDGRMILLASQTHKESILTHVPKKDVEKSFCDLLEEHFSVLKSKQIVVKKVSAKRFELSLYFCKKKELTESMEQEKSNSGNEIFKENTANIDDWCDRGKFSDLKSIFSKEGVSSTDELVAIRITFDELRAKILAWNVNFSMANIFRVQSEFKKLMNM